VEQVYLIKNKRKLKKLKRMDLAIGSSYEPYWDHIGITSSPPS